MRELQRKRNWLLVFALLSIALGSVSFFLGREEKLVSRIVPAPDFVKVLAEEVARDIHETAGIPTMVTTDPSFGPQTLAGAAAMKEVLGDKELERSFRALGQAAESAEVVIGRSHMGVIFYRTPRINRKAPVRGLESRKAQRLYGTVAKLSK